LKANQTALIQATEGVSILACGWLGVKAILTCSSDKKLPRAKSLHGINYVRVPDCGKGGA
jgi:hypothetical protein